MIEFKNVFASYSEDVPVLKGVNFTITAGEFVAVAGTNGAGKSTTMRLINGLMKPKSGEVLIKGVSTQDLKTSEIAREVGFLFQNPDRQICSNTVFDELMFGFRALNVDEVEARQKVEKIIAEFGFNAESDPFLLNRGSRQLLALASIVVLEPPVIILDEPTTGLDYRECCKVMEIVARLHQGGTTVVMVCHDMEVVADYAQRIIVMNDGQVIDDGETFTVLRNHETLHRASMMAPQIVAITQKLEELQTETRRTEILQSNTLNQLEAAIVEQVKYSTAERGHYE